MNFPNFLVYYLTSRCNADPGDATHCVHCQRPLSRFDLSPSVSLQEVLTATWGIHCLSHLYICQNCSWWMIREQWTSYEVQCSYDYLVVGVESDDAEAGETPWTVPLAQSGLYDRAKELPDPLPALFPEDIRPTYSKKTPSTGNP